MLILKSTHDGRKNTYYSGEIARDDSKILKFQSHNNKNLRISIINGKCFMISIKG